MATSRGAELFEPGEFAKFLSELRRRGDANRWNKALEHVMARVRRAVRNRFPDRHLSDDAVQSACRTLIRRLQFGEFHLVDADSLICLLVTIAFRKALKLVRSSPATNADLDDVADSRTSRYSGQQTAYDDAIRKVDPEVLRRLMTTKLEEIIQAVSRELRNETRRQMLICWLERQTGVKQLANGAFQLPAAPEASKKVTQSELASKLGCSVRTINRVDNEIEQLWRPLIDEAHEFFRAFFENYPSEPSSALTCDSADRTNIDSPERKRVGFDCTPSDA
ncbi:MAG TPA: hypothetical protein PLV92_15485 [Pirellulaceae bacterium]|nr:hypothetical protein [Pirellulaceae bacterium]